MPPRKCLIVLSGGQDSTLTIFAMRELRFEVSNAVFFDYGQRHIREKQAAKEIAEYLNIDLKTIPINSFNTFCTSALTSEKEVSSELEKNNLPNTFVPGRNIVFLSLAAAYAYQLGINDIATGVSQEDFSGYPDCRDATISALEETLTFGLESEVVIHTPMMFLSKADALRKYAAGNMNAIHCLRLSHTCYNGKNPPCGKCPACILRAKSFSEAVMIDPLISIS